MTYRATLKNRIVSRENFSVDFKIMQNMYKSRLILNYSTDSDLFHKNHSKFILTLWVMVPYWFKQTYNWPFIELFGSYLGRSENWISKLMPIQIRIRIGIKTNADPHADPIPKFCTCWKIRFFYFLLFSHSIVSLQCVIFLSAAVSNVSQFSVFSLFRTAYWNFQKNVSLWTFCFVFDPTKWCLS